MATYQVGERIRAVIEGRVDTDHSDSKAPGLLLDLGAVPGFGDHWNIEIPFGASGVTVTRVAPREWPPLAGDRWNAVDPFGPVRLIALQRSDGMVLRDVANDYHVWPVGNPSTLEDLSGLTLVSRDGWTPAEPEAEPERDERAELVARTLVAVAEVLRSGLTQPFSITADEMLIIQHYTGAREDVDAWAAALGLADATTATVDAHGLWSYTVTGRLGGMPVRIWCGTKPPEPVDEPAPEPTCGAVPEGANAPRTWICALPAGHKYLHETADGGTWGANTFRPEPEPAPEPHGAEVPASAHYEVRGWIGPPGGNGFECACGASFGGFDSIAEARRAHPELAEWPHDDPCPTRVDIPVPEVGAESVEDGGETP